MPIRACILGCAAHSLTSNEREFFAKIQPLGLILFKRNVENAAQVIELIRSFRAAIGRADAPVLIDQEGGRVQRLGPPNWPSFPSAGHFGEIYARDPAKGIAAAHLGGRLIAAELSALGINVDCLPVADLHRPEGHGVIGDRAYGPDPEIVSRLGRAAAEGLIEGGVLPVVKHIPGHGRARADSHHELPVVETSLAELERTDFEAFRLLNNLPIGMTAHVVYAAVDATRPATVSPTVIDKVIRGRIAFDGLLLTDDLSMSALSGSLGARTSAAFSAGCDIALHCNGKLPEMEEVASDSPPLRGAAERRANAALSRLKTRPDNVDVAEARARFSAMIAA
jgi:beta-N-acetylhexosaminidase